MTNATPTEFSADLVLKCLRENAESSAGTDPDGTEWCSVYLDNARVPGMTANQFAGFLSALERRGVYKPLDGYAFGEVRMS